MDWIYQGPACGVLLVNLVFLVRIMWVSGSPWVAQRMWGLRVF